MILTKKFRIDIGMLLDSLKRFAEFMEEGGEPKDFDKKALTITP